LCIFVLIIFFCICCIELFNWLMLPSQHISP
jgi:hypothetical protein